MKHLNLQIMRRRFARPRALFLIPLLAAAAACQDDSPTLTGDDLFPGGGRPTTLEVIVPAAEFLQTLGVYTGFGDRTTFGFQIIANQYGGVLDANTLVRFDFPRTVEYSQDGTSRLDSTFAVRSARLTVLVDSGGTSGGTTLEVYRLAQRFDAATATWTLAADTGGGVPWTQPGGTRGPLAGTAVYNPATAGDTVFFQLDSLGAAGLRADSLSGALIRAVETDRRVQLRGLSLTLRVRPSNAVRDTTLEVGIPAEALTFVFNPQQPAPAPGTLQAGGVGASRSVFAVDLQRTVPGCPPPESCADVPLSEVLLNRVSLLLKPVASPPGFNPLGSIPITLWTVPEPELGRRAPLGLAVNDPLPSTGPVVTAQPGDTLVEVPFTAYAIAAVAADTLPTTFALLGEAPPLAAGAAPRNFGVSVFDAAPRLRIIYTLPIRPRLP
ncbi:MAG TPA: hypothetical protein VFR81_27105 [Longimicrobium sp.]|nr:hypothetical protein [Longimicrobium sp.]